MTRDRIHLSGMVFQGRHGVTPEERSRPQPIEVDVGLAVDLSAAGRSDELARSVDYSVVHEAVRRVVEARRFRLLESIAETIAEEVLADHPSVEEVEVHVRKPQVKLGQIESAGVEIHRRRPA